MEIREKLLTHNLLERLEEYHGENTNWYIQNNSDYLELKDRLIELGDEDYVKWAENFFLKTEIRKRKKRRHIN